MTHTHRRASALLCIALVLSHLCMLQGYQSTHITHSKSITHHTHSPHSNSHRYGLPSTALSTSRVGERGGGGRARDVGIAGIRSISGIGLGMSSTDTTTSPTTLPPSLRSLLHLLSTPQRRMREVRAFFSEQLPMLQYLWPSDSLRLRACLVLSMVFMFAGKWFNLQVPFLLQRAIDGVPGVAGAAVGRKLAAAVGAGAVGTGVGAGAVGTGAGAVAGLTSTLATPVGLALLLYGLSRACSVVCAEVKTCLFTHVSQNVLRRFAGSIFTHLHTLDSDFHLETPSGVVSVAYVRAVRGFQTMMFQLVFSVAPTILELGMVAHILSNKFAPVFATITLATFSIYLLFTVLLTQWRVNVRVKLVDCDNERNGFFIDSVLNHEVVKLFSNEDRELQRFDGYLQRIQDLSIESTYAIAVLNFGQAVLFGCGLTASLLVALQGVQAGTMTVGDLVAVNSMLLQLSVPFNFMGYTYQELRQSFVDMGYMRQVMGFTRPAVSDAPDAVPLQQRVRERERLEAEKQAEKQAGAVVAGAVVVGTGVALAGAGAGVAETEVVGAVSGVEAGVGAVIGHVAHTAPTITAPTPTASSPSRLEFRNVFFSYKTKLTPAVEAAAVAAALGSVTGPDAAAAAAALTEASHIAHTLGSGVGGGVGGSMGGVGNPYRAGVEGLAGRAGVAGAGLGLLPSVPAPIPTPTQPTSAPTPTSKPLLRNLCFTVTAGQNVAIVGPSGSGKSTTLKLITRMLEADGGQVLLDGVEVTGVTLASLRQSISVVPQDTCLFDESVRYNILYSAPNASDEEVQGVVRAANLQETVAKLPQGLDTRVGERGARLSGGERQKVSIARALLRRPSLLLCDEITSSVDAFAERDIVKALVRSSKQHPRTTVTVAHRLSSIAHCDNILVLQRGRLVEQGTHAELLAVKGVYAQMWRLQHAVNDNSSDTNDTNDTNDMYEYEEMEIE
ncbi:hypothetical protein B484DRAFT_415447, partial [Ochromonadaceae sp. CCMP2298]